MGKPTMWCLNRSDTNQAVQARKMARGWKFWIYKVEELYYQCSENKGVISFAVTANVTAKLISFTVTAKLICTFVFTYVTVSDILGLVESKSEIQFLTFSQFLLR